MSFAETPSHAAPHEPRHGVIVIHPFGPYQEAQFLDDPALIESLVDAGESWRLADAMLLPEPVEA